MSDSSRGGVTGEDLIDDVFDYIVSGTYPPSATANEKRTIRNKAKKFSVKDGVLYYMNARRGRGRKKVSTYNYR